MKITLKIIFQVSKSSCSFSSIYEICHSTQHPFAVFAYNIFVGFEEGST